MATSKLLSHLLRRSRPFSSLSTLSHASYLLTNSELLSRQQSPPPSHFPQRVNSLGASLFFPFRSFSTRPADDSELAGLGLGLDATAETATASAAESGPINLGFSEATESLINSSGEELILPARAVISLLDGFHELTGLPWWISLASATLVLRIALLPILILQLKKLKRIQELFPKLPPPLPPPLSGRSYIDQISLFRKERRAIGCPSYLWFLASFSIQVPCFFLWVTSIRRMSLHHHPGFDCGGALWFQNLTESPHGVLGPIFPLLIAGLHYTNVQISFKTSSIGKAPGLLGLLAKYYKFYLDLLTLPLFFIGYCIPQGSLVYWVTNSSLSVIQQLSLKHPAVQAKLGLPTKDTRTEAENSEEIGTPGITPLDPPKKEHKVSVQNLPPKELLALSVQFLSKGHVERAIPLLRLALDKDPEYIDALIIMGQALLKQEMLADATEYLERAISKIFLAGHPTKVEDVDLLIVASQWAGAACIRQGKKAEGILHLERVANLKEPEDPKSKAHYFDGLVMLASALYNEGRKAEAAKYLRLAAAYNSAYNELLQQCESDEDNFVSDLLSSRRRDY